jgi:CcmD family protein
MHIIRPILLLAQQVVSAEDIAAEARRLQHDYEFLSYGLIVAWVVLGVYVLMMLGRQRKLKREIDALRAMLEDRQQPNANLQK